MSEPELVTCFFYLSGFCIHREDHKQVWDCTAPKGCKVFIDNPLHCIFGPVPFKITDTRLNIAVTNMVSLAERKIEVCLSERG